MTTISVGAGVAQPAEWEPRVRRRRFREFTRRISRAPIVAVALLILLGVVGLAVAAPLITPHDPSKVDVVARLKPPFWAAQGTTEHLLGTDSLGRDVFSRLVFGARVSMIVGFVVVAISGLAGILLGLLAGYAGGRIDDLIMRIGDIQLAFPFLLLAIAVLAVLGSGLINVIIVLVVWAWVPYARVVRAETMSLREKEFVEAARAIGLRDYQIILHHILPNTWAPSIVMASMVVANTILGEAALSFLGLGVKPSVPTWGGMLAEGRDHVFVAWWIVTFPGLAIMITVLCINLFGDWLRDYLDPRLRV